MLLLLMLSLDFEWLLFFSYLPLLGIWPGGEGCGGVCCCWWCVCVAVVVVVAPWPWWSGGRLVGLMVVGKIFLEVCFSTLLLIGKYHKLFIE